MLEEKIYGFYLEASIPQKEKRNLKHLVMQIISEVLFGKGFQIRNEVINVINGVNASVAEQINTKCL